MKSFNEYAQDKDIEAIKSILIEEGYDEPTQEQLVALLEAGILDRLKDSKLGKAAKGALLAGALAGAGMGQANAQGIRISTHASRAAAAAQDQGIRTITPSRHNSNSVESHWKQQGNSFSPRRGNGVIVNNKTNISMDDITDQSADYAHVNTQQPFKTTTAEGIGLNVQDAVKDALNGVGRSAVGVHVDSETLVKNDELVKDRITTGTESIIGKFQIVNVKEKDGLTRVTIKAEVQKREGQKASGAENHRSLEDGKFRLKKTTLNFER